MRNFVACAVFLLAICLLCTPFVAGQVSLTLNNNCGSTCSPPIPSGTSIGTVNVTQNGPDALTVTLTMSPGYTMKIQDGNDFNFNGPAGLTISNLNVAWDGTHAGSSSVSFNPGTGGNVSGYGTFGYNIMGIADGLKNSGGTAVTSVTSISFTVTSTGAIVPTALINDLNGDGANFAIHFCDNDGSSCSLSTGFAINGPSAPLPEPSILALLACSGLMFGFLRWRIS